MSDGAYDVVVVGSVNVDLVVPVVRRPAAGETVLGGDLAVHPGGKGANQAVAAALLGARTALIGAVGEDDWGRRMLEALRSAGVDVGAVRRETGPTGTALILVDEAGENSIVVSPGANGRVGERDVAAARDLLVGAGVVVGQGELPPAALRAAVEAASAAGVRCVVNLAPPMELPGAVLAACDPLVVNTHEAAVLLKDGGADADAGAGGDGDPGRVAAALLGLGSRSVVLTVGESGAVVADAEGVTAVAAPRVERVVDTTGAGDATTGALAARLAAGDDLRAAAAYAVRVGATAVTRAGAQPSFPRPEEVLGA